MKKALLLLVACAAVNAQAEWVEILKVRVPRGPMNTTYTIRNPFRAYELLVEKGPGCERERINYTAFGRWLFNPGVVLQIPLSPTGDTTGPNGYPATTFDVNGGQGATVHNVQVFKFTTRRAATCEYTFYAQE
jgi:hypothetical protein